MDDDSGYEVIEEEELPEEPVPQIDDDVHDTARMDVPFRAGTFSEWPPEPPLPADVDFAMGSISEGVPPRSAIEVVVPRNASIFAAVRRPTTSSETDD